ncbi:MAG: hypothetical protein GX138_06385 [Firmicutes bacterium]|jgi:hypothetical protein|nr:hypothetical protein [Bacillota bacterium]
MNLDRSIKLVTLFGFFLLFLVATFLLFAVGVLIPGLFDELLVFGLIILAIQGVAKWLNRPQSAGTKKKIKDSIYSNFLTYQLDGYIGKIDHENKSFSFFCRDGILKMEFSELTQEDLQNVLESLEDSVFPKMELHIHTINKKVIFYKIFI